MPIILYILAQIGLHTGILVIRRTFQRLITKSQIQKYEDQCRIAENLLEDLRDPNGSLNQMIRQHFDSLPIPKEIQKLREDNDKLYKKVMAKHRKQTEKMRERLRKDLLPAVQKLEELTGASDIPPQLRNNLLPFLGELKIITDSSKKSNKKDYH